MQVILAAHWKKEKMLAEWIEDQNHRHVSVSLMKIYHKAKALYGGNYKNNIESWLKQLAKLVCHVDTTWHHQWCRLEQVQNFNLFFLLLTDNLNIKILNAGAWARGSDRVTVSLPMELEDFIPEVEDFYRKKHSGRKLLWHHHMSNGTVSLMLELMPVFLPELW